MKLKTDSYAFRFFALNLFIPLGLHLLIALIDVVGPNLRQLWVALPIIMLINATNLTYAFYCKGWQRIGLVVIIIFNILSLFAMGALSFFTSLYGWVHIVPAFVALLFQP